MKKIFLLFVFLSLAFSYSYSQTYYYKAVAEIDKNGAKSKPNLKGRWITFINDKGICYDSDENGYKGQYSSNYYYRRTQNGTHIYESKKTTMQYTPGNMFSLGSTQMIEVWDGNYYYFSSDFSEMQNPPKIMYGMAFNGIEYIRTNGPEEEFDPNIPTF